MDQFPPQPPQSPPPYGTPAPPPGPDARESVKLPAIFLIITGGIGVLMALLGIVQALAGTNEAAMQQVLADPNLPPFAKQMMGASQSLGVFSNFLVLLTSGLVIYGAIQMMNLRKYGLAMASAIVAMIPCFGPCCCIGLPIGIWALVVLNKPEVKAAFANASTPTVIR